jgi:Glycosyl transferases group 1
MRILNVADFNWITGAEKDTVRLSLFDIARKLSLAAIRAGHLVVEFSDRAVARTHAPLGLRGLGGAAADRRFLQMVDELKPDLIFLHFADYITNAALAEARRLAPGVRIAEINIDPVHTEKNRRRLAARRDQIDALFVTTADPALGACVGTRGFAAFMPNPLDPAIETGRAFENPAADFHLFLPVSDAAPRQIGDGLMSPAEALKGLDVPGLRALTPGAGSPELRGQAYFEGLARCRLGWSLSRVVRPLYASDRMAHIMGCGLGALIDAGAGFQRFFSAEEAVFYTGLEDLSASLHRLIADDAAARALAEAGWRKAWSLFHADRVFAYLIDQLDGRDGAWEWPGDRRR